MSATYRAMRNRLMKQLGARRIHAGRYEAAGYTVQNDGVFWRIEKDDRELAKVPSLLDALIWIEQQEGPQQ